MSGQNRQYVHSHVNRKKPLHQLSQQEEYIRRITEPRTPEDLVLALQNTWTLAYKDMMNKLAFGAILSEICEELTNKYLCQQYKASEKEKEEILQAMENAKALAVQRQIMINVHVDKQFSDINKLEANELREIYFQCEHNIKMLSDRTVGLDRTLVELDRREIQNLREWRQETENRVNEFIDTLSAETSDETRQLHILNPDTRTFRAIEPSSQEAREIAETVFSGREPAQVARVLSVVPQETVRETLSPHMAITRALTFARHLIDVNDENEDQLNMGSLLLQSIRDQRNKNKFAMVDKARPETAYTNQLDIEMARVEVTTEKNHCDAQVRNYNKIKHQCAVRFEKMTDHPITSKWELQESGKYKKTTR